MISAYHITFFVFLQFWFSIWAVLLSERVALTFAELYMKVRCYTGCLGEQLEPERYVQSNLAAHLLF